MRALITGISGFIGGHLYASAPPGGEIWGTYLNADPGPDAARALRLDLRDAFALEAAVAGLRPDLIIHAAAWSRVAFCEAHPAAAREVNTGVTATLAQICRRRRLRLIFLSSDMVFDGEKGHFGETDEPRPLNLYGRTKLAAERFVAELRELGVIVRLNLVYGPPRYGGSSFSEEVIRTVRAGRPYSLFADQRRSFLSVQNLAACLWEIARGDFSGLIHLGGSEPADRVVFARKLAQRMGLDPTLLIPSSTSAASPAVRYPRDNTFNLALARRILKTPLLNLDDGLALEYP